MGSDHLADRLVELGYLLQRAKRSAIERAIHRLLIDVGERTFPGADDVRHLGRGVTKQSGYSAHSHRAPVGGVVAELVGVDVARQRKHRLARGGRAELVREVAQNDLRVGRSRHRRRIRQRVWRRPPDGDRMLIDFVLVCVGSAQFCVFGDGVVQLAGRFPAVLWNARSVSVVAPPVAGIGSDVRKRIQLQHAGDVLIEISGRDVDVAAGIRRPVRVRIPRHAAVGNGLVVSVAVVAVVGRRVRRFVENTVLLILRRFVVILKRVVGVLDHVLIAAPEEQLVVVPVEMREDHRTADVSADVIEVLVREICRGQS